MGRVGFVKQAGKGGARRILRRYGLPALLALLAAAFVAFLIVKPRGTEDYFVYGIDQYGSLDADGRSDAMMLVRLDHTRRRIYAVSIARDLFVENEAGRPVKINTVVRGDPDAGGDALAAYAERNFGFKPDAWIRLNFSSLVSIVDAIGGVTLTLSEEEARYVASTAGYWPGYPVRAGECLLCGGQALAFVRCRYLDNDLGRGQRQSRFAAAMVRALSHIPAGRIRALYDSMGHAWRTSLSAPQQAGLLFRAFFARRYEVVRLQIPFEGAWRYGSQGGVPGLIADLPENRRLLQEALSGRTPE